MKRTLEFVIDCGQENMDVRTFVRRYLGFSARILTALKYEGEMLKNGEPVHSNAVLKAGDTLTLTKRMKKPTCRLRFYMRTRIF